MQFGGSGVHTFQNDNGGLFEKITVMMVMPGIILASIWREVGFIDGEKTVLEDSVMRRHEFVLA